MNFSDYRKNSQWSDYFDVNYHAKYGDTSKSRIMILTRNKDEDETKIFELKANKNLKNCYFHVFEVDPDGPFDDMVKEMKEFRPTNIVLNFIHDNIVVWDDSKVW